MNERKDFVKIKLSASGERFAAGAPLGIANRHCQYTFTAGEAVEVTRAYEWESFLSKESVNGEPMFEVVTDQASSQQLAARS